MSNTLLNISMITKESLMILKNNLAFAKGVNRTYDDKFAQTGAKIGAVLNIRKPVRYTVTNGAALNIQSVTDESVPLTLSSRKHVGFQFTSQDLTLSIDEFSERYLAPAIASLANQIDYDGLNLYQSVYQSVGTPGTDPNTALIALQAGQKLDEAAAPMDGNRSFILNPAGQVAMVDSLKGLFQSSEKIAEQYEKGRMGDAFGLTFKMDQNVNRQTVGSLGGTPLVSGASQTGSSLVTNGWTVSVADLLNVGDVFTIAGVHSVNPQSYISTGNLQSFVVTATASSNSSGVSTVSISPSIITSGAYQTVDVSPASGAAITVMGTAATSYAQNLVYHKDAFCLGMVDLELPGGVDMAARASDPESGLALRITRAYDVNSDQFPCRIDVLYGWAALRPELACRVWGA